MTTDKWLDGGSRQAVSDPDWPIHDRIAGIQSSALTTLLNPSTLRRVYDNEFRIAADQDALTLPELLETVSSAIWGEIDQEVTVAASARKPAISSLRRNLQREHVKRLVDLAMTNSGSNQAYKPISNLARAGLRATLNKVNAFVGANADKLDAYSAAHLAEIQTSITKALDADIVVTK